MATRKARAAEALPDELPQPEEAAPVVEESTAVRVLVTCYIGKPNDVAMLDPAALAAAVAAGLVDPNPDAVAAAAALR